GWASSEHPPESFVRSTRIPDRSAAAARSATAVRTPAAPAAGGAVLLLAPARAALLAAAGLLVHRRPGAALGLLLARAALLVPLLDVVRPPALLARVTRLASSWHGFLPSRGGPHRRP